MQRDAEITELLNEVLTAELTSVNQYFVDSKMLENWGYDAARGALPRRVDRRDEGRRRVDRADPLPRGRAQPPTARHRPRRRDRAREAELALDLEYESIERLNRGIDRCLELGDNGTRELLEHILEGEEAHADWLETQLGLIGAARRDALPRAAAPQLAGAVISREARRPRRRPCRSACRRRRRP